MKRTVIRAVVLAILSAAVLAAAVLAFVYVRYGREAHPAPHGVSSEQATYILGAWEGKLAVFEGDAAFPVKLYDVALAALPPEEQERLRAGIAVEDAATLQRLLEDYTS